MKSAKEPSYIVGYNMFDSEIPRRSHRMEVDMRLDRFQHISTNFSEELKGKQRRSHSTHHSGK